MSKDKRKQERVKVNADIYYFDPYQKHGPQKLHKKHDGQVVDISANGICISTRHEFYHGSILQFNIKEHFENTFTGFVKRCVRQSDDEFHIGLEVPFK